MAPPIVGEHALLFLGLRQDAIDPWSPDAGETRDILLGHARLNRAGQQVRDRIELIAFGVARRTQTIATEPELGDDGLSLGVHAASLWRTRGRPCNMVTAVESRVPRATLERPRGWHRRQRSHAFAT